MQVLIQNRRATALRRICLIFKELFHPKPPKILKTFRPMQQKSRQVHIVPRTRDDRTLPPVTLTLKRIEEYFSLPLNEASKQLGVSASALKW